jgi:hypothetical protein
MQFFPSFLFSSGILWGGYFFVIYSFFVIFLIGFSGYNFMFFLPTAAFKFGKEVVFGVPVFFIILFVNAMPLHYSIHKYGKCV